MAGGAILMLLGLGLWVRAVLEGRHEVVVPERRYKRGVEVSVRDLTKLPREQE